MKKYLITGGAGFIGSNFINFLLKKNQDIAIINLDALTYAGNLDNLESVQKNPNYSFIHGNICDADILKQIFSEHRFSAIIHFAAETHVDRSIHNPMVFIDTNIVGTANLLRFAYAQWVTLPAAQRNKFRFIHISTDEVFGTLPPHAPAFQENTPYAPNSPYAASKAASDHIVRSYFHTYHLPVIITNCSNNYGPYQYPEKLIPLTILNAMAGKNIPIYGDGQQIRDWLYVEDHCQAIHMVIQEGSSGETYNIGGNNQWKNLDLVLKICDILDQMLPQSQHQTYWNLIHFIEDRPGHDRRYAMNIEKIGRDIGWHPQTKMADGLKKTVQWYLQNDEWVQKIREKSSYHEWLQHNYFGRGEKK